MKSQKFALHYFVTALFTVILLFLSVYFFTDIPNGRTFSADLEALNIFKNPLYIIWISMSLVFYIISRFVKTEKGINILNKTLVFLPIVALIVFYSINIFLK